MPQYEIEQYELHCQTYQVEAGSEAEAIAKLFTGEAEAVNNSLELIEVATDFGLPADEYPDLASQLRKLGVDIDDDIIPSVRSIEQVS